MVTPSSLRYRSGGMNYESTKYLKIQLGNIYCKSIRSLKRA